MPTYTIDDIMDIMTREDLLDVFTINWPDYLLEDNVSASDQIQWLKNKIEEQV